MKERILKILDNEKLTATKFADRIGVQRSSISHIISGRNKPSFDFIEKTINSFSNISAEWLINGKGNMYRDEKGSYRDKTREPEIFTNKEKSGASQGIINTRERKDAKDTQVQEELIVHDKVTNVTIIEKILVLYENGTFKEYNKID